MTCQTNAAICVLSCRTDVPNRSQAQTLTRIANLRDVFWYLNNVMLSASVTSWSLVQSESYRVCVCVCVCDLSTKTLRCLGPNWAVPLQRKANDAMSEMLILLFYLHSEFQFWTIIINFVNFT